VVPPHHKQVSRKEKLMGFNALNMTFSDKLQQVIAERVKDPITFGLLAEYGDMTSTAGYDNDGSTGPELLDNGAALRYHPEAKIFFAFGGDQCFYQFGHDEDDAIARLQQSLSEKKSAKNKQGN
jgi:hypothetical protein